MPTMELQDISIDSGWSKEYIDLANRFDAIAKDAAILSKRDWMFIGAAIIALTAMLTYKCLTFFGWI